MAQNSSNDSNMMRNVARPTAQRLSEDLIILEELHEHGTEIVSSRRLAELYGNNASQVRQDLFCLEHTGRAGQGYSVHELERSIRRFLGIEERRRIAIVGCGRLGTALALHVPLANYGLDLAAMFDVDPEVVGTNIGPVRIDHADRIDEICEQRDITLAVLSVPTEAAQQTADRLTQSGVRGILNFTRVRLRVPPHVVVENRQLVCSFLQLAYAAGRNSGA